MVYFKRVVKRRPASMTAEECASVFEAGRRWQPTGWSGPPPVRFFPVDPEVKCWWCREVHLASEVLACMALPMKRSVTGSSSSSTSSALEPGPLGQYSELWGFLTLTTYPDGTRRRTGRVSLSCESGVLRCSLSDEETGQYASMTSPSLDELLTTLELAMADGSLPWRESKFQGKGRKERS